jgi:hypothetical protein
MTTLDRLPLLVLDSICEILIAVDDNGLSALCRTSKALLAAATPQRFRQVELRRPNLSSNSQLVQDSPGWLESLEHCIQLLDRYDAWRHVRRLALGRQPHINDIEANWDLKHDLDLDPFFIHPRVDGQSHFPRYDDSLTSHLVAFIERVVLGLQDLVWGFNQLPPEVVELLATSGSSCRLHVQQFELLSLWQSYEGAPRAISDQDYKLASSQNLTSVIARHMPWDDTGRVCYLEPAIRRMIQGAAPNLRHVSLRRWMLGASLGDLERARRGRPEWRGFYPDESAENGKTIGLGALRSLVLRQETYDDDIRAFGAITDMSQLRNLTVNGEPLYALAELAGNGQLSNLKSVSFCSDREGNKQEALSDILEGVGFLCHLCVGDFIGPRHLNTITKRHGQTLRSLHLIPDGDFRDNPRKPSELLKMDAADVRQIAESCPHLVELEIPVTRSRGNEQETAVYQALSKMTRLQRLRLHLCYWVGPNQNADDNMDQDQMYGSFADGDIAYEHVRDAIKDCAIDETLARSILAVSDGGKLSYLRLEVNRERGRFSTIFPMDFEDCMALFARNWVCQKSGDGEVTCTQLNPEETQLAQEEWSQHSEWRTDQPGYDGRFRFKQAFEEIWHPDVSKPEWWNEWKSLPLHGLG